MEDYKKEFIEFIAEKALEWWRVLKSGRLSPYFVNMGNIESGEDLDKLGRFYAAAIMNDFGADDFTALFGPAYKGFSLVDSTVVALARDFGVNKFYTQNRKESKRGEGLLIGHQITNDDRVIILDDVFTTGETKRESLDIIASQAPEASVVGMYIGVDRQEIDEQGRDGIKSFEEEYGVPVKSIVTIDDILRYLPGRKINKNVCMDGVMKTHIMNYLKKYGVKYVDDTRAPLIKERRSIIPACDVRTLEEFQEIVSQTGDINKIGAYKLGITLALRFGLRSLVKVARDHTDKPLIYDHQKGGNDIPDLGGEFAMMMLESGIDAAILFPHAGKVTQYKWAEALRDAGKRVLVGAEMTHAGFKQSEGGSIADEVLDEVYTRGVFQGVRDFVIPGNKRDRIGHYVAMMNSFGIKPTFYAPGFVAQGGDVTDAAQKAGDNWHAIVGRGIYEAKNIRQAAMQLAEKLTEYEESLRVR